MRVLSNGNHKRSYKHHKMVNVMSERFMTCNEFHIMINLDWLDRLRVTNQMKCLNNAKVSFSHLVIFAFLRYFNYRFCFVRQTILFILNTWFVSFLIIIMCQRQQIILLVGCRWCLRAPCPFRSLTPFFFIILIMILRAMKWWIKENNLNMARYLQAKNYIHVLI